MNIEMLCRSCMKDLSHNDPEMLDEVNNPEMLDEVAMDMFLFCINQQAAENDQLPKHFCPDCNIKIYSSYIFIKRAKEVNKTLLKLILQNEEIKDEYHDDENNEYLKTNDLDLKDEVKTNHSDNTVSVLDNMEDLQELHNDDGGHHDEGEDNYIFKDEPDRIEKKTKKRKSCKQGLAKNNINLQDNENNSERQKRIGKEVTKIITVVPEISIYNNSEKIVKEKINANSRFSCKLCKKTYTKLPYLKQHYKRQHGNESKTKIKPEVIEKLIKDNALNKNNLRQCPVCDKTYKWQNRLITHLVREHSMDVKSMEQYACPYCPLIFISSLSLHSHKEKVHNEDRQFGCNACDKRFRKRAQLAVHALSHSEDRPFICDTCHMSFKLKDVLIKHLAVHESDRPFLCEICAKGFKKAGTLKDHMLTHAGARVFACNACNFTTTSRSTRSRHMLIKHAGTRPHACTHCEKTFVIKSALNRHMRIHTGEKPCKCPSCPLAFVDHWKRKMHIMRVHQVPFEEIPRLAADGQPLDKW